MTEEHYPMVTVTKRTRKRLNPLTQEESELTLRSRSRTQVSLPSGSLMMSLRSVASARVTSIYSGGGITADAVAI